MSGPATQLIQQGWTQEAFARDKYGISVHPTSDWAVCWCARGALYMAYPDMTERISARCRLRAVVGEDLIHWNDALSRIKEDVVEAFRKAGV